MSGRMELNCLMNLAELQKRLRCLTLVAALIVVATYLGMLAPTPDYPEAVRVAFVVGTALSFGFSSLGLLMSTMTFHMSEDIARRASQLAWQWQLVSVVVWLSVLALAAALLTAAYALALTSLAAFVVSAVVVVACAVVGSVGTVFGTF